MAAFYLISLALGVLIVSMRGSSVDLMHVLFGTVLALNDEALTLIAMIAAVTLVLLAIFWRALVAECLDPLFLRSVSRLGTPVHFIFLGLVVLNLVGGFQALGTLLSVGLMMLPAAAARFWTVPRRADVRAGAVRSALFPASPACFCPITHRCPPARRSSCRPAPSTSSRSLFGTARRRCAARSPAPSPHRLNPKGDRHAESHFVSPRCSSVITLRPSPPRCRRAEPLKVVASFSIIGDFARNVGGDRIDLTTIVGPDGDAHVYEPKPADAIAMAKADVVLVNGLHFEGFLQRLVEASATKATVVELTKGVEPLEIEDEVRTKRTRGAEAAKPATTRRHRSARLPVDRQRQDLCEEHRRRVLRRRRRRLRRLQGQRRRLHGEARRARRRGEGRGRLDPGRQAHDHHLA